MCGSCVACTSPLGPAAAASASAAELTLPLPPAAAAPAAASDGDALAAPRLVVLERSSCSASWLACASSGAAGSSPAHGDTLLGRGCSPIACA